MVTTFFGPLSFGGDAVYVDHLSRALARRGHEVEVVHCAESFRMLAGDTPPRPWAPPHPGVMVHTLESPVKWLAPLWTQQTGTPGPNTGALRRIFDGGDFDVIHFHNISLLGGPGALRRGGARASAVKLMTLHDYWLVCPMHLMWKLGRRVCERPQCLRCTIHGKRPPQLWRRTGLLERGLEELDTLLAPSRHSAELHRERGIQRPIMRMPYHLPADWASEEGFPPAAPAAAPARPYFAAAGRLVDEKGFDRLIGVMADLPEFDLRLAGGGPREEQLRRRAGELPNVELLGQLSPPELAELYRGARAVVVPSLFPETFGYVAVEAMSVGTPAIVSSIGALPELIEASGGGVVFGDEAEMLEAMRRLGRDDDLRAELGARGTDAVATVWSEDTHLDRYLELVDRFSATPRAAAPGVSS
jgi:glycosyltransferase involved in cell wall biosynthesis